MKSADSLKDPKRRAELAKIHLAKKFLRLDEAVYRAIIYRVSAQVAPKPVESAGLLDARGRRALLDEMKRLGFREAPARDARSERDIARDSAHVRKIRACWLDLKNDGALEDPSERALRAFVERQTGVVEMNWLTPEQTSSVIEALKQWRRRYRGRLGSKSAGAFGGGIR